MQYHFSGKELVDFSYQILQLASHFENISDETIYRVIVSRSYYGAFLLARNKNNITDEGQSVHHKVITSYSKINSPQARYVYNSLLNLKKQRQEADYNTNKPISRQDATNSLSLAKKITEKLQLI